MKLSLFVIILFLVFNLSAQVAPEALTQKTSSVTIGILQGGGSLLGADFESLVHNRLGLQLGAGLYSLGGGINYHLSNSIRSSFISFQYSRLGIGNQFMFSTFGPNYVYRGKKWLTAQFGLGYVMEKGTYNPTKMVITPVQLIVAIGAYFPI